MKYAVRRAIRGSGRAVVASLFTLLVASCTSAPDGALDLGMPAYTGGTMPESLVAEQPAAADGLAETVSVSPSPVTETEGETALPHEVAMLPVANPAAAFPDAPSEPQAAAESATPDQQAAQAPAAEAVAVPDEENAALADTASPDGLAPMPSARPPAEEAVAQPAASPDADAPAPVIATAAEWPQAEPPKKKGGLLSAFFGASPAQARPAASQSPRSLIADETKPVIAQTRAQPVIELSPQAEPRPVVMASLGNDNALPGVRQTALFEIRRKSGIDDDSDVDLHEDEGGSPVRLASAAGLARLAPNGLLKQTDTVDTACLKPSLVRVLKSVERHFGRPLVITSGYRSMSHNRRARGAKNSLHMYCAAADVQVPGVGKAELARFVRAMPGRGGVGTYCHTESVHVDVGPERDWNWRCRRRK